MSSDLLQVVIDRANKTAIFFGPGTFQAKEIIKTFGKYQFDSSRKAWIISSFNLSAEELEEKLPGISIEENNQTSAPAAPSFVVEKKIEVEKPEGALSVLEFIQKAQAALKSAFASTFCIYGVLSDVKTTQDRVFMELAEQEQRENRVKCVIWNGAEKICAPLEENGFKLEVDLPVMFVVSVGLNIKGGQLSLTVKKIVVEYTKSKLASLRDQTNERLRKEGIFSKNKELHLAFLPKNLGVLTSSGGTVINDFIASLTEAKFDFNLYWLNVNVQGAEARNSVLNGIKTLSNLPNLDAILIFRGGGSQAELSVFNDYEIAKAVCLCPLPVVTAIGHQEDQCSLQDVSYLSCGVPKEIGWFFANIIVDYKNRFLQALRNISKYSTISHQSWQQRFVDTISPLFALGQKVMQAQDANLKAMLQKLPLQIQKLFTSKEVLLANLGNQSYFSAEKLILKEKNRLARNSLILRELDFLINQKENKLISFTEMVQAASPEVQLKRGFAIVKEKDSGVFIKKASQVTTGNLVNIEFCDNTKLAEIK